MSQVPDKASSSQITSYTVNQTANQESWKLQYDIYKHLTTLNTGSILLLVTFLEKIFVRPAWKVLVIAAFCLLFISIIASFIVMNILASVIREMKLDKGEKRFYTKIISIALIAFLLGILCLIIFAVGNLYMGNLKPQDARLASDGLKLSL